MYDVNEKLANAKDRCSELQAGATAGYAVPESIGRACKVPLSDQLGKQACHLAEQLERVNRLREILKQHPEFETYEDFRELLERRNW